MGTPLGYNRGEQALVETALEPFPGWGCFFLDVAPSTQDLCRDLAFRLDLPHPCVIASHQTRGRGRRGREWSQEPGLDLSFSLACRTEGRYPDLLLPLLLAAALWRCTKRFTEAPLRIKWPNDLLAGNRKLAGVLIEASSGGTWIAGIGLNVNRTVFGPGISGQATSLSVLNDAHLERAEILASLLACIASSIREAEGGSWEEVISDFHEGLGLLGKEVEITCRERPERGKLVRVDPGGIHFEDGRSFDLGEVTALEGA